MIYDVQGELNLAGEKKKRRIDTIEENKIN